MSRRARVWILVAAVLAAALVRWPLLTRQGLWVDEVFSLALATGHSLEHPAAEADAARGDFVEEDGPRPAEEWRAYLRHEATPAGAGRVVRAVRLSDTSPPLYYLVLWAWTRVAGTSDAALRGLSLVCTLLCLPLLARLARWSGGVRAIVPALFLFALTPLSVYYGTEGRMYALLWLVILAWAWCTLHVRARPGLASWVAWSGIAALGFLTHYFFAFVWGALVAFLFVWPGRARRRTLLVGLGLTVVLSLPWYAHLGESLGRWRVTRGWLEVRPEGFERAAAALELLLSQFSGSARLLWGEHRLARLATLGLFALLALTSLRRGGARPANRRLAFAGGWLLAACAGPLLFDALQGTYTAAFPRYALPAFPAATLLAGAALARHGALVRTAFLAGLALAFGPHLERMLSRPARSGCPLREVARSLEPSADGRGLMVVHSVPSGVLGIARYYEGRAELLARVEQLGPRPAPSSLFGLGPGRERLDLVRIHEVGAACPLEDWLRAEAVLVAERRSAGARVLSFRARGEGP